MPSNELTLVSFTLLAQMAAGAWLLHALLMPYKADTGNGIQRIHKKIYLILLPIVLVSVLLSFFHLGNPAKAFNALNNLESSWLSREILFISLLALFTLVQAFLLRKSPASAGLVKIFAYLGALIAFLLVYSMSEIYMLETVPAWNSLHTPLEFLTCSLLLGGILILLIYKTASRNLDDLHYSRISGKIYFLFILLSVLFVVDLGNTIFNHFINYNPDALRSQNTNYLLRIMRFMLLVVSLILLVFQFYYFNLKKRLSGISGIIAAFIVLFVAEILGRFIFYASYSSF